MLKYSIKPTSSAGQYVTIKKEGGFRKSALILCGLEILAAGLQPGINKKLTHLFYENCI